MFPITQQLDRCFLVMFVLWGGSPSIAAAEDLPPEKREFSEKRIRPVLVEHCYGCHSPDAKTVQGNFY